MQISDTSPATADDRGSAPLTAADRHALREALRRTRDEVLTRGRVRARGALAEETALADEADQATANSLQYLELRMAEKDRKLIALIEQALDKFDDGSYGVCEGSGEPIPLARLQLRPWARYSVEYKQLVERERALHEEEGE